MSWKRSWLRPPPDHKCSPGLVGYANPSGRSVMNVKRIGICSVGRAVVSHLGVEEPAA